MPDPAHGRSPSRPGGPSPLEAALERVGDRWSLLLVEALLDGPRRFNELGDAVPGIAPNILTDRLRRLERERIVGRDAVPAAAAADVLRADRRRPRPRVGAAAAGRLGCRAARTRPSRSATRRAARRSRRAGAARPATSRWTMPQAAETRDGLICAGRSLHSARWTTSAGNPGCRSSTARRGAEPGRGPGDRSRLPPSLQGLPPRSVPEVAPTPLQPHYINLSVVVLICGAIAITALELGASLGSPLVKLCVLIAAPLLVAHDRRRGRCASGARPGRGCRSTGRRACSASPGSRSA